MRDYRMWLLRDGPAKRSRVYVNSVLTALDDFHVRRGLGKADVAREDLRKIAPRALEECARIRWLRAVEAHLSPRGRCIALIPYYAGARISEVVRLDVGDVQMWARKGRVRLYGKGGKFREVDIHPKLRTELRLWLDERPNWPHADDNRALFLNAKGGRLTARAAGGIIAAIAQTAGLDDATTAHVLRHTLTTTLIRGKDTGHRACASLAVRSHGEMGGSAAGRCFVAHRDGRWRTTVRAEVAFTNGDLVAKGQDLDVLVPISHRQQPQRSEGVRDG
ncbi:tyrosine-type recombinase/integrase [Nonomuraea dietziae]|uniref:tyrosine-type recombinase/integrase n=1 Tax=Nonomuraea dietziae TaxID=65515 RepID=UPI00340A6324